MVPLKPGWVTLFLIKQDALCPWFSSGIASQQDVVDSATFADIKRYHDILSSPFIVLHPISPPHGLWEGGLPTSPAFPFLTV